MTSGTQTHNGAIALNLPMKLIQALRLCHAVMESGFEVHVASEDAPKFLHLQSYFPVHFVIGDAGVPVLPGVSVSHREPLTRIGSLVRPLIFPRQAVERCRSLWSRSRPNHFFFRGLLTEPRARALSSWLEHCEFEGQVAKKIGLVDPERGLSIHHSRTGREFPDKIWDEAYLGELGRSRFALCPSGDHVWTYRFFEAVLCGAMPVVEEDCPAYRGFVYLRFADNGPWGYEEMRHAIEDNYERAASLLTVTRAELDDELLRELEQAKADD